jgi:hypothetical protein
MWLDIRIELMITKNLFWDFFDNEAAPRLAHRESTFRKVFEYLDKLEGPITIVETGCVRLAGNWAGDGQSTILFDKYINARDESSICYTVDINSDSVSECLKLVSHRVKVSQDDSVHYLHKLAKQFQENEQLISFVYLDSFDVDWTYWQPSAIHHLKEFAALQTCINKKTLIAIDDCPLNANFLASSGNKIQTLGSSSVGGKGRLVAEYAKAVGAKLEFAEYQAGWTGF